MKAEIELTTQDLSPLPIDPVVLWTRGKGTGHVAGLLSPGAERVEGDLKQACITARADLLVTAKSSSFDLVSTAVPHGIDEARPVAAVVGAVGAGPHSVLAASIATHMAASLGSIPLLVTVSRHAPDDAAAEAVLDRVSHNAPGVERRVVRASSAARLFESLPTDGLLVLGAPGGSWWQRQFFGPGRRLIHGAPAGSIVVRAAPRRCFHEMGEVAPLGRFMRARDAVAVVSDPVAPVAEEGRLVGMVDRQGLVDAADADTVADLMGDPVAVLPEDSIEAAGRFAGFMDGAPVPVVDEDGYLLGGLRL